MKNSQILCRYCLSTVSACDDIEAETCERLEAIKEPISLEPVMKYQFTVTDGLRILTMELRGFTSYLSALMYIVEWAKIMRLELIGPSVWPAALLTGEMPK